MKAKNVFELVVKIQDQPNYSKSLWILAGSFNAALEKAQTWVAKEKKNTGEKLRIDKLEYNGYIDIF